MLSKNLGVRKKLEAFYETVVSLVLGYQRSLNRVTSTLSPARKGNPIIVRVLTVEVVVSAQYISMLYLVSQLVQMTGYFMLRL